MTSRTPQRQFLDHDVYDVSFGLGHGVRLLDHPGVFKVSQAGLSPGEHLVRTCPDLSSAGAVLDVGTGSGALALLMRDMGADNITASDVSAEAVSTAVENEVLNFPEPRIGFATGSLFEAVHRPSYFDLVVFNAPGWRTPSTECVGQLRRSAGDGLDLSAMFSGERVVRRFLEDLPGRLAPSGKAIIGLNSLVGIRELLSGPGTKYPGRAALNFRLRERHRFPLFFYSTEWRSAQDALITEFTRWKESYGAAFDVEPDGTVHWFYEIIEVTHRGTPGDE